MVQPPGFGEPFYNLTGSSTIFWLTSYDTGCCAAFIEFEDNRDAEDAVRKLDGEQCLESHVFHNLG